MSDIAGIGVDLTQHMPQLFTARWPEAVDDATRANSELLARHWPPHIEASGEFTAFPPVALLPFVRGEPLLVGDDAANHRRSMGQAWPPEAEVPFGGDPSAGTARIPLAAAWAALLPKGGSTESLRVAGKDHEFAWSPDRHEIVVSAGGMLAQSIWYYLKAARLPHHNTLVAIVVPDSLDESGQQVLLDSFAQVGLSLEHVHLIPRPVATAIAWCNSPQGSEAPAGRRTVKGKTGGSGWLRVHTQSFDAWESLSMQVRSQTFAGREWLVPWRRHSSSPESSSRLALTGLGLAFALSQEESGKTPLDQWGQIFCSGWLSKRLGEGGIIEGDLLDLLERPFGSPLLTAVQSLSRTIPNLAPILDLFEQGDNRSLLEEIRGRWESQEKDAGAEVSLCGELRSGAFAPLFDSMWPSGMKGDQSASGRGAALAAAAIAHRLPAYQEALLPLDLFVRGVDEHGDPKPSWKKLVSDEGAVAGRVWKSREPITGLQIEKSQQQLLIPLRRAIAGTKVYRKVNTALAAPARRDEPVRIDVEVTPGQGFARIVVNSVTPGVFSAQLDWTSMKETGEPQLDKLAYLPGVSRVICDERMFQAAGRILLYATEGLKRRVCSDLVGRLREAVKKLNKFPLAHVVEKFRREKQDIDWMLHYGVLASDGNLENLPSPAVIRELREALEKRFLELHRANDLRSALGKQILRVSGWMYLAMPEACYSHVRSVVEKAKTGTGAMTGEVLHCAGLTFERPDDLKIFYLAVARALAAGRRLNNYWLRALRNICKFRNHALNPDVLPAKILDAIVEYLLKTMQSELRTRNFGQIFTNCLQMLPFLLKRRRYEPFLAANSALGSRIINFLSDLSVKQKDFLPVKYQGIPASTLNFIQMSATHSDLEQLLGVEDDEDSDGGDGDEDA